MAWLFSKRCQQTLRDKKIKVSIPVQVRLRIWRTLQDYDEWFWESTHSGSNYETSTLEQLPQRIQAELGVRDLLAYPEDDGEPQPSNLEGFVLRGNYPPYLFDALELFYESIEEDKKNPFQHSFNQIMEENGLRWRMADGKIFPVDSAYIAEEITRRSYELLHEARFHGALQEFEKARTHLANGVYDDAIQNANLAVESVIKQILGIEKAKPGELFRGLVDSGLIPQYYKGFLKAFEENILRCVAIMRNEELGVGHGRGASRNVVSPDLAELAVNLSGVLINFLVKEHLRKSGASTEEESGVSDENLPFD
jgi:HEPN domain-containing protein